LSFFEQDEVVLDVNVVHVHEVVFLSPFSSFLSVFLEPLQMLTPHDYRPGGALSPLFLGAFHFNVEAVLAAAFPCFFLAA